MGIFVRFRKAFTECKVFVMRSLSYITVLNSGMILFLLLSKLEDYGLDIKLERWFFPIFLFSMLAMIFVGYLDHALGFHREEARSLSSKNPYFEDIVKRLDSIERKLGKKK